MRGIKSCITLTVRCIGLSRDLSPREATLHGEMEVGERFVSWHERSVNHLAYTLQSIYGGKFNDDKAGFKAKFKKGSLAMANSGKNTNSSQFFVVLTDDEAQLTKLDGKYVLFGQLRDGWEVLDDLDSVGGGTDGKPTRPAWVGGCGLL